MTNYVNAYAKIEGTKKTTTTTTLPPLLWMLTPSPRLRTRGVQSYQQTLRERPFLSTCHLRGQHCIIVRRAAPERAAWPTAPQLGATPATTSLLPSPPHHLSHHTVLTQPLEGEERDAGQGEASTSQRQPRRAALKQRELLDRLLRDNLL